MGRGAQEARCQEIGLVRVTAWYSLSTRGLVVGGGVGGGVGSMVHCNSYSDN